MCYEEQALLMEFSGLRGYGDLARGVGGTTEDAGPTPSKDVSLAFYLQAGECGYAIEM